MDGTQRQFATPGAVTVRGAVRPGYERILTPQALTFIAEVTRRFRARRDELLARRRERQARFDAGERPDFLPETRDIRDADWTVGHIPQDLVDRRVEITGPTDRKMVINALNSGANVFMADFEDACSPTWDNIVGGQNNLCDAVRKQISHVDPATGRHYMLGENTATLVVRPRGWHLDESHAEVDGAAVPGSLWDFGLYLFHNAEELIARGTGPYFYLPKMQSYLEARLWNDVFVWAEEELAIPRGTIKTTVLIETLPAAFEMDEILYELREHIVGLNCGRWDYIFSFIKTLRADPRVVLPDRSLVTMEQPCMRAYSQLAIRTCHRREAHAMGGMSAFIPVKNDPDKNARAFEQVRADKLREVHDGHDGTWVAHPGLVPLAREVFDTFMPGPNQLDRKRMDVEVTARDLLAIPTGPATVEGLRHNIDVGVQYLAAWLGGTGSVPIYDLMEDAATAEISRTQVWQWVHHHARVGDEPLTRERFERIFAEEVARLASTPKVAERFAPGTLDAAADLFSGLSVSDACADFLTLPAYERLLAREPAGS